MAMNPRLLRPLASGFSPRRIADLAVWYDAGVSSSLTFNGSTVSQINDLSGNGRHATQATAANQPSYSTTDANGRPALTAPSGAREMLSSSWDFLNAVTVFVVAKNTNNSFGGYWQRGAAINSRHAGFRASNSINARRISGNDGSIAYTGSGYDIIQWSFSPTLGRVLVNGVAGADNTASVTQSATSDPVRIMALAAASFAQNGGLAEFLYYDRELTAIEAATVRKYLAGKYNITST